MTELKIEQVTFADVAHLAAAAARDHVSISDTKATQWFAIRDGQRLGAVAALLDRNGKARLKGIWVQPDLRGRGLGHQLTQYLINHAVEVWGVSHVEALAHNPGYYLALGWRETSTARLNGAVMVGKNF